MKDLNALAQECFNTARVKGWWPGVPAPGSDPDHPTLDPFYEMEPSARMALVMGSRNMGEMIALVHSEASEALEDWRTHKNPSDLHTIHHEATGKPVGFAIELADILIRVLDMAAAYGIDLVAAVEEKMVYNRTRPERHGGKRA